MGRADGKRWREGEIRQVVAIADRPHKPFDRLRIGYRFAQEHVEHRSPCVPCLEGVLKLQHPENIFTVVYWQLGGVGIQGGQISIVCKGAFKLGKSLAVAPCQSIAGPLCRCGFEIVKIAGFLLECLKATAHVIQYSQGEGLAVGRPDILTQKVETGLVAADDTDG